MGLQLRYLSLRGVVTAQLPVSAWWGYSSITSVTCLQVVGLQLHYLSSCNEVTATLPVSTWWGYRYITCLHVVGIQLHYLSPRGGVTAASKKDIIGGGCGPLSSTTGAQQCPFVFKCRTTCKNSKTSKDVFINWQAPVGSRLSYT